MFAFLCKPVPVLIKPNETQVVARDCRLVQMSPSKCEENSFELKIINAPPITISTKNFHIKGYKKLLPK